MNFVHLNVKSHASFLHSSIKTKDLIKKAKELNQGAVALTDYGNVFNAISFYKDATKNSIKPILGAEVFFVEDRQEYRVQKIRKVFHLILLAENNEGWKNIVRLVSEANSEDSFFYKPRVDFTLLEKYSSGIILLCGSTWDGLIPYHLYDKTSEDGSIEEPKALFKAEALIRRLLKIYDQDHIYLEVQNQKYPIQQEINDRIRNLSIKYGIKTVATNNVHYLDCADAESHRTLNNMAYKQHNPMTLTPFNQEEFTFKSRDEMSALGFTEDELNLTVEIANRCNVKIDLKKRRLPKYKFLPSNFNTSKAYLEHLCWEGFNTKKLGFLDNHQEYIDRLNRELFDINEMGFDDYFLIVWDVCDWIIKNNILLGPGRGSAGGSLVSYCLGITNLDPIKHKLIWERFLNRGRVGLPDIDSDVPRSRRQDVLKYIQDRFGSNSVAQIVTFNALKARAALKDVFSVYGMDFSEANLITSIIPAKNEDHSSISIAEALEKVPKLKEFENKYKSWFKIAQKLEDCYKALGTHASAVMISDTPFEDSEYPLCRSADGKSLICAFDMESIDNLNLLKLDILGLNTLDDISEIISLVKKNRNIDIPIQNGRMVVSFDDASVYDLISEGRTAGVFQLETQLGKSWSKRLRPENIDQLSALGALLRPGCLSSGETEEYERRRNGESFPLPPDESLREILKDTLGIMIYQEEQIAAAKILTGWDLSRCDLLRKAIGKKLPEEIRKYKDDFYKDSYKNGFNEDTIDKVWNVIEKSAGYSFNASHSYAYGMIGYQTAYLKTHFAPEFFCAKLRNAKFLQDSLEETKALVNDAKLFNIAIIPPRVKRGNIDFDIINDKTIAFGLSSLKGVGEKSIKNLLSIIKNDQQSDLIFSEVDYYLWNSFNTKLNSSIVEALIKGGAFDDFGVDRITLLSRYRLISELTDKERELVINLIRNTEIKDWVRIIKGLSDEEKSVKIKEKYKVKIPNVSRREKLRQCITLYESGDIFDDHYQKISWEKHYLGIGLSGSEADIYKAKNKCNEIMSFSADSPIELAVTIESVKQHLTKTKKEPMAFITAGDNTYLLDNIVVFPRQYRIFNKFLEEGSVVRINGIISNTGSVIVEKMEKLR